MLRRSLAGLLLLSVLLPTGVSTRPAVAAVPLLRPAGPGIVDWRERTITVVGEGHVATNHPEAQARLLARRAALAEAYRQLAAAVGHVQVTVSHTADAITGKNRVVRTRVEGLIQGAIPGEPVFHPDGRVLIPVTLPLYGNKGLSWGLELGQMVKAWSHAPWPAPETAPAPAVVGPASLWLAALAPLFAVAASAPTGVIIDAGGLGAVPAMAPFVVGVGQRVYVSGKVAIDPDRVVRDGLTNYVSDLDEAKADVARIGTNPTIVTARGVVGHPSADILISNGDAEKLEQLNQQFRLLDQLKVTVVI